jgi:hypothetical protein
MRFARTAAFGLIALGLAGTPLFAQQNVPEIAPNQLVEQMLRSAQNGDGSIVEFRGYVGPSTPETVKLYPNLSLSSYLEIPRSAIVNAVQEGDPKTGPVKLYVRGSATIVTSVRHSAGLGPFSQRAGVLAAMPTGNSGQVRPRTGADCLGICTAAVLGAGGAADFWCGVCLLGASARATDLHGSHCEGELLAKPY